MKRVLKLALPPVLAILLVAGYGSGTMMTLAKTIMTQTHITETIVTEKINDYSTAQWGNPSFGFTWISDARISEYGGYWWKKTTISTDFYTEIPVEVSDEPSVSDKTVPKEKPKSKYDRFQDKINKIIEDAEKQVQTDGNAANVTSDPIVLDTGEWVSFKGDVYQKLQDIGRPIQITFRYKGKHWRVDIPAGADLMSLVDENGYCGFMNLVAHFGGTELED